MVIIGTVIGDLLNAKEPYVAQQCNCNTVTARGLSSGIAKRWKHGDVYSARSKKSANTAQDPDEPGTVVITRAEVDEAGVPVLLHLMAQWTPGKLGSSNRYYPKTYQDTRVNREQWFQDCLDAIDDYVRPPDTVAMPYLIGCGLAGGKWETYQKMLEKCKTKIKLYRLKN